MSDEYIKREDAINTVRNTFTGMTADTLELRINGIPSADVAPVVRCKDCKYYQDNNDGYPHDGCRWRSDETPDADDFCSMAERKDNE